MSTSEFLVQLDRFGLTAAGWIATWFLHSLVLCALALLFGRVLRTGVYREQLCKVALLGAFVTTAAQAFGVGVGHPIPLQLESSSGVGPPIAVAGVMPESTLPEMGEPRPAAPAMTDAAPAALAPGAHWRWAHALPVAALLLAIAGGVRLLAERRRLARVLDGRRVVRNADWKDDLRRLSRRAGLARAPRLTSCDLLGSPIALASDELVVPARALSELDRDARRALLAHELAHVTRRDPRWLAATALLCHLFALQPLQFQVRRRLQNEMELACDAQAVCWTGGGLPLARCLATVAAWIERDPAPALVASMASSPSALVRRVEHALAPASAATSAVRRRISGLGLASVLAVLACAGPQVETTSVDLADPADSAEEAKETMAVMLEVRGASPTLDFENDGRILAEGRMIYDPDDGDYAALEAHLRELLSGMERQPVDPQYPDGFQMGMGELVLHAAPGAPARSLQKAMEYCGRVGIWRLRMTGDWPGGDVGFEVPLPVDLEVDVPVEIEEEEELGAEGAPDIDVWAGRRVEVMMKVMVEGRKVDPVTGAPWGGSGRFVYDDSRRIEYRVNQLRTQDIHEVRSQLESLHEEHPDARALIDARQGTVYKDVTDLLDLVMSIGYRGVTFVGSYE